MYFEFPGIFWRICIRILVAQHCDPPYRAKGYSYTYRIYAFQGIAGYRALGGIAQLCWCFESTWGVITGQGCSLRYRAPWGGETQLYCRKSRFNGRLRFVLNSNSWAKRSFCVYVFVSVTRRIPAKSARYVLGSGKTYILTNRGTSRTYAIKTGAVTDNSTIKMGLRKGNRGPATGTNGPVRETEGPVTGTGSF